MVLKLYGMPPSSCTKRVATTLKEYNVPYELIVIDLQKGAHKDSSYKEIQPFGQVPYIVRNFAYLSFLLFLSHPTGDYLPSTEFFAFTLDRDYLPVPHHVSPVIHLFISRMLTLTDPSFLR